MSRGLFPGKNFTTTGVDSQRIMLNWVAGNHGKPGLASDASEVGIVQTTIGGGSAGNHTVAGIATEDSLVSVVRINFIGTNISDISNEFSISGANTINNTGGTDTTLSFLLVTYIDKSSNAAVWIDPYIQMTGINASASNASVSGGGGISFSTAGADGDSVVLVPHSSYLSPWQTIEWGTDQQVEWSCSIKTGAADSLTNSIIWSGLKLTSTSTVATDDDQIYFRYENGVNGGRWQSIVSIGGVDTVSDTGISATANTIYSLRIAIFPSRVAKLYIDNTRVDSSTALSVANLIPVLGIMASGAAETKSITVFGQSISRILA